MRKDKQNCTYCGENVGSWPMKEISQCVEPPGAPRPDDRETVALCRPQPPRRAGVTPWAAVREQIWGVRSLGHPSSTITQLDQRNSPIG